MKNILLLMLIFNFQVSASLFSQQTVTLNLNDVTLKDCIKAIESQTELGFLYNGRELGRIEDVSVEVTDKSVEEVLTDVLTSNGYTFVIKNKTILIKKKIAVIKQPSNQQQEKKQITGTVSDEFGVRLPGVSVVVKGTAIGTSIGTATDVDGNFTLEVPNGTKSVLVSFIGMVSQEIELGEKDNFKIALKPDSENIDEVTIVAFGKQKKESVMASIETIKPSELKVASSNLTSALAGRMSGLISYQRSGEPGEDDASFFIRGVTSFSYASGPLILIDGVESNTEDLSSMQPDDIESFSILKDAAATALYGARGGNGVIMVVTKQGVRGKMKINVRHEQSISTATKKIDIVNPTDYMRYNNEAILSRDPFGIRAYSLQKIERTEAGFNESVYPANNWYDLLFNDVTRNSRTNFNLSGGGQKVRYYLAGSYSEDNGNLKVDDSNNFNSNIDIDTYLLRSNVTIDLTKSTEAVVRFYGRFKDYTGPLLGGSDMYSRVMRSDPAAFAPYYDAIGAKSDATHILFGNSPEGDYINPYSDLAKGYRESSSNKMQTQIEIKQDLSAVTSGLNFRVLANVTRDANFDMKRQYDPYYYYANEYSYNNLDDSYSLTALNPEEGTEWIDYKPSDSKVVVSDYFEASLSYNKTFNDIHGVSAMFVATRRNSITPKRKDKDDNYTLALSLPSRNVGYAGRVTYSLNDKYFSEFNFGYNGSERFAKKNRWGFFPSVGLGYMISKEDFWQGSLKNIITSAKLKATYGLSGTDAIGDKDDRFFYLSNINLKDGDRGYRFGERGNVGVNGVKMLRYPNEQITWETSTKMNLGVELELFNKWTLLADYYTEHRTDILMERKTIPATVGLLSTPKTNVGEAKAKGIDLSLDFNHSWSNGLWLSIRGNFTYAVSTFEVYEDVDRSETPWLTKTGQATTQQWGYVAERLFIDDADVQNSPQQAFSEYGAGDLKYRDINGDGRITSDDRVPIGHPTSPEIIYGFGFSGGYKGFDVSCFFQGLANESFWIDAKKTAPFVDVDEDGGVVSKNAFLQVYADDHWSKENPDPYALWPKLSDRTLSNNTQKSTWWMRDGAFLRLKSLEVGYTLPKNIASKIGLGSGRIYVSGTNLLTFSKFKLWDPEMAGNGFKYPIQKVYNLGIQIGL